MTAAIYDPVTRLDGLERLDLVDWNEVHETVQAALRIMDQQVRSAVPTVDVRIGANSAEAWFLFSYRIYAPPSAVDVDPIVVGITFGPGKRGVAVHGDICGETLGDVLFDLPVREVMGKSSVLEAAVELGEQLSNRADAIIGALNDRTRRA